MTDIQLLDKYCDTCLDFIHPVIYRDVESRGLAPFVNKIGTLSPKEAKAIVRARLSATGRYTGDAEIEQIASVVDMLNHLKSKISGTNSTNAIEMLSISNEIAKYSKLLIDFYK